jgi:hypothetical protein
VWKPSKKGTLLIPSGTTHDPDKKHLFVICALNHEDALLATIASWTNDFCDGACILEAGEHPFIVAKSYVLYRKCRIEKCETLSKGVASGVLIPRPPFADAAFSRICDGINKSKQIPWKIKKAFKGWKE